LAAAAVLVWSGCGGEGPQTFRLDSIGLTLELPMGWKQGDKRDRWEAAADGSFFFLDADNANLSGEVRSWQFSGADLAEHVDQGIAAAQVRQKANGDLVAAAAQVVDGVAGAATSDAAGKARAASVDAVISKTPLTLSGLEAIEVVMQGERTVLAYYIRKGDRIIAVSYGAAAADYPRYETSFRESARTISIK
jgi:hypothetical protein